MAEPVAQAAWPALRAELILHQGPLSSHGSPTYTLHDPARHAFWRLGWLEAEIISRWGLADAGLIAEDISRNTPIEADKSQIERVLRFLKAHSLTTSPSPSDSARLAKQKAASRPPWYMWLMKNYLFMRFTLIRPDGFLDKAMPYLSWIATPGFLRLSLIMALLAVYLIWRQWDMFTDSMAVLASLEGWLMIGLCLAGVKVAHEFGHAVAAKHMGCRVPAMGLALMCFFPVCWTDTTDAWKLKSNRKRLVIDSAGVTVEIFIAALASILWSLLPLGSLKTACYVLASTTWIASIAINIIPFLRYDGYYILGDLLDEPQLQSRSFALARWKLRQVLFGWQDPPPEHLKPKRRRTLFIYAYATWVYRFFLFLGIALLVYHLFFKAMGVLLMVVEIFWFILAPIGKEIMQWNKSKANLMHLARTGLILAGFIALLAYPWQGSVSAPAVLAASPESWLHVPINAKVQSIEVNEGQEVNKGQVLLRLHSPEVKENLSRAQRQIELMRSRLQAMSQSRELMQGYNRLLKELGGMLALKQGLEAVRAELLIRAPFDGVVRDTPPWLMPGAWVTPAEPLLTVLGKGRQVRAMISEQDLARLAPGAEGRFYPSGGYMEPIAISLTSLDYTAILQLRDFVLASSHGGPLAVQPGTGGALVPEQAVYRGRCRVEAGISLPLMRTLPGKVVLEARPESWLEGIWRNTVGLIIRESGW